MINAHRTGAYISSLRKAKDWTQQELAEKLHVTHQAVSQWEKGASFPDIGLLPQLARLLGTSVDAVLNGEAVGGAPRVSRGALIEEYARGNAREVARLVADDTDGVEMMLDTAPLARPSQLNEVVNELSGLAFTLPQLASLAPFISEDALHGLLGRANLAEVDTELLKSLAPFVGTALLDQMARAVPPGALDVSTLCSLAPHLGEDTLSALLVSLLEGEAVLSPEQLEALAPHLDEARLDQLLERLPEDALPLDTVASLAPHISQAALDRLIGRFSSSAALGEHLRSLAPFLSEAALQRAVLQRGGGFTAQDLLSLAPFLDRETLEALIGKGARV